MVHMNPKYFFQQSIGVIIGFISACLFLTSIRSNSISSLELHNLTENVEKKDIRCPIIYFLSFSKKYTYIEVFHLIQVP